MVVATLPNMVPSTLPLVKTSLWWKYTQLGTKFLEGFPGKSFGENVCKHVLRRHIVKSNFMAFNLLMYKMVLYVNVLGSRVRYWIVYKCNAS